MAPSDNDLVIVVLLLILLLGILPLIVGKPHNECLFALVLHLDQLRVRLEGRYKHGISKVVMATLLVDLSRQLLDLQIVEALMHEQINAAHFVELVDTQTANRFEDPEEDHAEDDRPGDNH